MYPFTFKTLQMNSSHDLNFIALNLQSFAPFSSCFPLRAEGLKSLGPTAFYSERCQLTEEFHCQELLSDRLPINLTLNFTRSVHPNYNSFTPFIADSERGAGSH